MKKKKKLGGEGPTMRMAEAAEQGGGAGSRGGELRGRRKRERP